MKHFLIHKDSFFIFILYQPHKARLIIIPELWVVEMVSGQFIHFEFVVCQVRVRVPFCGGGGIGLHWGGTTAAVEVGAVRVATLHATKKRGVYELIPLKIMHQSWHMYICTRYFASKTKQKKEVSSPLRMKCEKVILECPVPSLNVCQLTY